jgi:hypothetical protein
MVRMTAHGRTLLVLATLAVTLGWPVRAGHTDTLSRGVEEPPTRFERFVLSGCSPCVTESYPVAAHPIRPLKLPTFPRAGIAARPGEVRVETLRAYNLGRPSRQLLAMRVTLSVGAGTDAYRFAVGLLDEDEVPALVSALEDIAKLGGTASVDAGAESIDMSFGGGSLRVGLLRFQGESVAYVQAGDLQTLALRPVWEVGGTMYMSPGELPTLANVIGRVAGKIKQLRGF